MAETREVVVVTGGSGQLGSLVLARLCASRKLRCVVSLDLVPPSVASAKLDWKIADVRDPGLERHFEGASALVHLAFIVTRRAPAETMRAVNVEASKKLFSHAVDHGLSTIVYSSSVAAYGLDGPHELPLTESAPRRRTPWLSYADNKWEVEGALDELEQRHPEVRIVRLRPSVLMGRHMPEPIARAYRSGLVPKLGSGRMPMVWDEDVADAVLLALFGKARGAFNLSAAESLTAEQSAAIGGYRLVPVPKPARWAHEKLAPVIDRNGIDSAWLRAAEIDLEVSSRRAEQELGWRPSCPTARDVMQRFAAEVPKKTDRRISTFLRMLDLLGRRATAAQLPEEARRMKLCVHLELRGPRGGDFTISLQEGKLGVRRGVPRPPQTLLSLDADTLLELLSGKLDFSAARMTGKLRVSGEPGGALLLGSLVTGFRNATGMRGLRGWSAAKLSGWFDKQRGAP